MAVETVRLDWIEDAEFLLKDHHGFPVPMAQPMGVNAADLLPLSVVGCAAWDVAAMMKKQRQTLTSLQVSAESEREDAPPWRFLKIHLRYRIGGRGLKEDAVRRVVALTEEKYCATLATLRAAVEITSTVEVFEDGVPPNENAALG